LFHGFQHRLIPKKWIIDLARSSLTPSLFGRTNAWILSYFAPELEAADPDLCRKMIDDFQKNVGSSLFPYMFNSVVELFCGNRDPEWVRLKLRRNIFSCPDSIISHMCNDNASFLQERCQDPMFSIDTRVKVTPYIPTKALSAAPTLIQIAAFFGATQCFRWLLSNGANLLMRDSNLTTLTEMAAAGGSLEIIRLCQQYGLRFYGTVHAAISHHRNEIVDWLLSNVEEVNIKAKLPIHAACKANNIYLLEKLPVAHVNVPGCYCRQSPLQVAVRNGHTEAVAYLLSLPDIDVNYVAPLLLAAANGNIDSARMLLAHNGCVQVDVNKALLLAVRNQREKMVQFLLGVDGVDPNTPTTLGIP
jgi:hypothetical protein